MGENTFKLMMLVLAVIVCGMAINHFFPFYSEFIETVKSVMSLRVIKY